MAPLGRKNTKFFRYEDDEVLLPILGHMRGSIKCNLVTYQPSVLLPRLKAAGKQFFELIKDEDVDKVNFFLQKQRRFSVNCQNYGGATGLTKAISIGDIRMVDLLLEQHGIIVGDSVLHAVDKGDCAILVSVLDKLSEQGKCERSCCYSESPDFSPDMTPIMLAAINQDYEIIRLLLSRGHFVEKPHPASCHCKEKCWEHRLGESLRESMKRLTAYKALASPAYICQSSPDPILTAFELTKEFQEISELERELGKQYLELCNDCKQFAVELMSEARTTYEVKLLLRRKQAATRWMRQEFHRLGLAVELCQKEFVAHPNVQQVIGTAWLGDWNDWRTLSVFEKIVKVIPRFVFFPIMALIYLCLPNSNYAKSISSPINKFMSMTLSYIIFLVLLFVQNSLDSVDHARGPPHTGLETLVIIYVVGLIWMEIKKVWFWGLEHYYRSKWSIYNTAMLTTYLVSFGLWIWAFYDVKKHGNITLERKYWYEYDPSLIAEGVYAIATVLAFGHLFYVFQIFFEIGPMQVSVSRMLKDIVTFLSLFTIIIFSFAMGIHKLYHYYNGRMYVNEHGVKVVQSPSFETFYHSLYTLFWSVFAMSHVDSPNIVKLDIGNATHPVLNTHGFTEAIGHILFATYHVIVVIVLVNMLIAMMSNSYQYVANNADLEWKFARTRVWLGFFEEGGTLPPPFNLIPSPYLITRLCKWIGGRISGSGESFNLRKILVIENHGIDEDAEYDDLDGEYQLLMARLVQRFLRKKEKEQASKPPTVKDMYDLENEVREAKMTKTKRRRTSILKDSVCDVIKRDSTPMGSLARSSWSDDLGEQV